MLVARGDGRLVHARARDLPDFLRAGDLVVINTSATLPAALPARRADGAALELRLSTPLPGAGDDRWVVELRAGAEPFRGGRAGDVLDLPGGAARDARGALSDRRAPVGRAPGAARAAAGLPRAPRCADPLPLCPRRASRSSAYETAYATEPGSAEMPSAGRPFTPAVLTRAGGARRRRRADRPAHRRVLARARRAPVSRALPRAGRDRAARAGTRGWGGRVIAVGTTVVRALETVARADGTVEAGRGGPRSSSRPRAACASSTAC